jgi:dolichol-phosphate mannosyltransferase
VTPAVFENFALVIPTLNEVGNIATVLDGTIAALSEAQFQWEILVVDDDSSDGTADRVRQYSESEPRVRVLVRRGQRGLAGAINYGWSQTNASLLGVMDADLQHPPELLPELISKVRDGSDIAIASRYLDAHSMDAWNPLRRVISRLGVFASKAVQKPTLTVKDPLSGFFVVKRECVDGLDFQRTGFKLLLEILARGRIRSVSELPFTFATRQHGRSKAGAMTAVYYVSLLYKLSRDLICRPRNAG